MIATDLKEKWETLEALPKNSDYDLVRASSECGPELSVSISPEGERGLVLALPADHAIDFREVTLEKLCLKKIPENNFLVVILLDSSFHQLFDDLVVSMHNAIKDIVEVDAYSQEFLKTFGKWARFFERQASKLLNESVVRGIFGELIVLRRLLTASKASDVNSVLSSWKGPYDRGQDFVSDDLNIEVKTRTPSNASVKIANENQLDNVDGKGLQLAVVCLDVRSGQGLTLGELIREVIDLIEIMLGDTSVLYRALSQKNLGPTNLTEYDSFRFVPTEIVMFDCCDNAFPRLVRSTLPIALSSVHYSINTDHLEQFVVGKIVL